MHDYGRSVLFQMYHLKPKKCVPFHVRLCVFVELLRGYFIWCVVCITYTCTLLIDKLTQKFKFVLITAFLWNDAVQSFMIEFTFFQHKFSQNLCTRTHTFLMQTNEKSSSYFINGVHVYVVFFLHLNLSKNYRVTSWKKREMIVSLNKWMWFGVLILNVGK